MSWIQIKAAFPAQNDLSPFIEIFRDHGIENTLEENESLTGALADVAGASEQADRLMDALRSAGAVEVTSAPLPEENWEVAWRQFFKPRRVGAHFVVRPTWESYDAQIGDIEIVLDPGQAFGTGDHPTTRLCLELLEQAKIDGAKVADIGCGSGILSVAACKLGADQVHAVDIEPVAVEVAKENALANNVHFTVQVGEGIAPVEQAGAFDVVISNIISAILIRLAKDVYGATSEAGRWIVSGIIVQNWSDVQSAAEAAGFELIERREEDGWVAAIFLRK